MINVVLLPGVAVMAFKVIAICNTSFSVNKFFFLVDFATCEIIVIIPWDTKCLCRLFSWDNPCTKLMVARKVKMYSSEKCWETPTSNFKASCSTK